MARQTQSDISSMSGGTILLQTPRNGQTTIVESAPAGNVRFEFDPSETTTAREGNNLVFVLDNGGTVVLTNFFVVGEEPLPVLTLPDGTQVAAGEYLHTQFPGLDLTTAAGPNATPVSSSGAGDYTDSSGSLVGGLERFGSLGTDHWNGGDPTVEHPLSVSSLAAPDNPVVTPGGDVPTPPGPTPSGDEFSRLIISNTSDNPAMVITVEDAAGHPVTGTTPQFTFEDDKYFRIKSFDPATGKLELELTEEGLLARQNGLPMNDKLTITVNGESYDVHLIGDQDAGYTSDEDPNLRSEWFVSDGGLADADVTLGGKFTNEATINGPALMTALKYTEQIWHGWGQPMEEVEVSEFALAGVAGSRIDTGERGLVHINVDNLTAPDDAPQRVAGILGRSSADNTTIIGNEIDITARVSNAHGTPISEESRLDLGPQAMAAGIDNNRGTVSITAGDKLTILGETRVEADGADDYYRNVFVGVGVRTGGLEDPDWSKRWDEQGNPLPQGSLSLQADILEIKGAVSMDGNTLGNHEIYAEGLHAGSGSVDLTGNKISIEGAIDAYLSSSEGWNGDLYSAAGLAALGQNGDLRDSEQEFLSSVKINGTDRDDDRLDITATINLEGKTEDFQSDYIDQRVVGIQTSLANLTIRDIEHISVTAKATALGEPTRPNQSFRTQSIGMDLYESTVDITNSGNLTLEVTAGDRGIQVSRGGGFGGADYDARLNVHAGQTLNVDIEAGSLGIYSNAVSDKPLGEDPRVHFSSDGALNMTVSVHDGTPNYAYNPDGVYVAGIEAVGDSYQKLWGEVAIDAGGPLNLTVDVSTPYETFDNMPVGVYSLYAHEYGAISIHSGAAADSISLTGDVHAASNGMVDIATGAGADRLSITGDVSTADSSSKIHFDLGDDADTFTLNGNLAAVGTDTNITVDMGKGNDTVYLNGHSDTSGFHSTELSGNIQLNGGEGDDLLNYKFTKAGDLTSLADAAAAGKVTSFEHLLLDMDDGVGQNLHMSDLDALLNNLCKVGDNGQAAVYIKGDAGDTLDLTGWNSAGSTVTMDGIDYALYQNDQAQHIYIQLTLITGG